MLSTRGRRGVSRLAAATLLVAVVPVLAVTTIVAAPDAAAAGACATPGGSGAGGTLTGIVNTYYPGVGTVSASATSISVGAARGAATPIANGDMLLVIQMQAADINSTNTNSYGHGGAAVAPASGYTALNNTGLYEYVRATSAVSGGAVSISGLGTGAGLLNSYTSAAATATTGQRTFQVIRVPQYTTATTSSTLTAAAWNGATGGILALDTTGALTLNGTVSVDGLGFRGATAIQAGGAAGTSNTDVAISATLGADGSKAEGVAGTPVGTNAGNGYPGGDVARGAPGNAGGGGTDGHPTANDENSGGGGGGNGGAGGIGGNSWNSNLAVGGYGGVLLPATSARTFLGGGGGSGSANNFAPPSSNGAAGGGMVLIRAASVAGAGSITANGVAAINTTANDGGGGGGAGGTIVLTSTSGSLTGATLAAKGGRGGDAWDTQAGAANQHGPGGGGGGGWIITSSAPTAQSVTAGAHGITTTGNLAYGSADGAAGQTSTAAVSTIPGVSGGAECADVSITKTGTAAVGAGGTITYSLVVANAGPASATGVSVVDTLPAGVTFGSATGTGWVCTNAGNVSVTCTQAAPLASGATANTITVTVQAPPQAGTATNTAAVSATTPDPDTTNNTSSASTTVTAVADLHVAKIGPATVTASGNISYTVTVNDIGPSDAAGVSVLDTLPAGVTFVSATGTGWTCTNAGNVSVTCTRPTLATGTTAPVITIVVTAPAQGAALTNSATVSSTSTTPTRRTTPRQPARRSTPRPTWRSPRPARRPSSPVPTSRYTLVVVDNGPSDAASLTVSDTLPAGVTFVSATGTGWTCTNTGNVSVTCTRPTLASGPDCPDDHGVVTAPSQAATLSNTASRRRPPPTRSPATTPPRQRTTVTASADLADHQDRPRRRSWRAARCAYSLVVVNNGPSDAAASPSPTPSRPASRSSRRPGPAGRAPTPATCR